VVPMNDKYNKQEYLKVVKEVDVLVVGGGPAGVGAALSAASVVSHK